MSRKRRFLVLTLNAAGNWSPERELIRALAERGHAVRVITDARHERDVVAAGAEYRAYRHAPQRTPSQRHENLQETEQARILRTVFFNPVYADELAAAFEDGVPDALLVDAMLLTAAAAAERAAVPTAVLWHTVYGAIRDTPGRMAGATIEPLNEVRSHLGLAPVADRMAATAAADAILALTYDAFDVLAPEPEPRLHYVGPLACVRQDVPRYDFPWPAHDRRPLVLVSYSTTFQDQVGVLQRVADAVANLDARVLLTLGSAISAAELQLPDNVVAVPFVPHAAVLPHARLVVTHAGHGTVMAAVTAGVPLLCTPMGRDQHAVSACVARRGVGVVVPMTASATELRDAIAAVLADDALRERARAFAAGLDVDDGLRRAVEVVEQLGASRA